jgi:hypothetical protein
MYVINRRLKSIQFRSVVEHHSHTNTPMDRVNILYTAFFCDGFIARVHAAMKIGFIGQPHDSKAGPYCGVLK